ncbi:Hypothetical protein SMAX5B_017096 [Scophthalmus maximus]|uniref:Uncharacterized protein n=1 Tax=Scophthalmus maximus TaxID=52904 RepID=A0A2U9BAS3_SCOMX|nr:Hypothetical protein SMAX5B_017096 [Scophthalmus maximus]
MSIQKKKFKPPAALNTSTEFSKLRPDEFIPRETWTWTETWTETWSETWSETWTETWTETWSVTEPSHRHMMSRLLKKTSSVSDSHGALLIPQDAASVSSGPRFHADGVREPSRTTRPPAAFESDEVIYIHGCCLFESTQRGECEVPAAERRNHRRRFLRSDRGERLFREEMSMMISSRIVARRGDGSRDATSALQHVDNTSADRD